MIETKQAQEARIFALKTEIDKLGNYIMSTNNPEYEKLRRQHKVALNQKLHAMRAFELTLSAELPFLI